MSKILYACTRNKPFDNDTRRKLRSICISLTPDNINVDPESHRIFVQPDLAYAVYMDNSAVHASKASVLLGFLFEDPVTHWSEPGKNHPDGNYALFRASDDTVEIVSDCVATRTIWYYHDDELFIASTSQRAIMMYLESFSFDERTIPWFLSTGSLGPHLSWDRRLRRLQADASVRLDRKSWKISESQTPIIFEEVERRKEEHRDLLADAITQAIKSIANIDFKQWALPLSGGYDSRGILCFIKESIGVPENLRTVTWGLERSTHESGNDAKIAKDLAKATGVNHEYYHTDVSSEPIETIIDRYIFCSEGRVDHIAGYMDGMNIWKKLHDDNVTGIIRGDEGFGWTSVSSELATRLSVSCALCSDIRNLSDIVNKFELPRQELPKTLERKNKETLDTWRDRLCHAYELPTILSALSDIKFSYVEQINPFLSRAVLSAVRSLPDNLRTDKLLFRNIVESIGPNVPFATKGANASRKDILRNQSFVDLLKSEIGSSYATNLFGREFTELILKEIKIDGEKTRKLKRNIKARINSILPTHVKNILRDTIASPTINGNILALRVFIIIRMHKMLTRDSAEVSSQGDLGYSMPQARTIRS